MSNTKYLFGLNINSNEPLSNHKIVLGDTDMLSYNMEWSDFKRFLSTDLTDYATETFVTSQGYLTSHQDLSIYAVKSEIFNGDYNDLINKPLLDDFATKSYIDEKNFLTEHQDLSDYATKNWVNEQPNTIIQSNWTQTNTSEPDYIKNKNPYLHGKEFTLSDTYAIGTLGWQLTPGDNLENAFGKVEYALDKLLVRDDGHIIVIILDNGIRKDGSIIITDSEGLVVYNGNTLDGTLSTDLEYGKYTIEIVMVGYDILKTSVIVDNYDADNDIVNNTAINVDVAGFDSTITFEVEPSIIPELTSFTINDGALTSSSSNLRLNLASLGIIDYIMVSQDPSFSNTTWINCTDVSNYAYTFNYISEITLELFVKVKNSKGESNVISSSINMINGITRSDSTDTYNDILTALDSVIESYPSGLTEDVELNVVSEVYNTSIYKFLSEISNFNTNTIYTLTINGNNLLTINCVTNGGFRLDYCDNIIFNGINFVNVASMKDLKPPEQTPAFFINRCNNIIVNNCSINGDWLTDSSYKGWYAVIVKNNNNFTISNTIIEGFGLTVITVKDTNSVTFKNITIQDCPIDRGKISQPSLVELSNIENFVVQDSIIDGLGMDTCFSGNNIMYATFERTKLFNCPGEIISFTNTTPSSLFALRNCLIYNNLTAPYYSWTKQQIVLGTIDVVEVTNNTVQITPVNGNNLYAVFIRDTSGKIGTLNSYNNIFDIDCSVFELNNGQARVFDLLSLDVLNSDYNIYRDYSTDLDEISNLMMIISDETSPVYIARINSLSMLRSLGADLNSTVIDVSTPLFINNDFTQLDQTIIDIPINYDKAPLYDIDKMLANTISNLGCKYNGAILGTPTNVIKYIGNDIVSNVIFTQDDTNYSTYSKSLLLLSIDKYDDDNVYKWKFENSNGDIYIYYGNNIGVYLPSFLTEDNLYESDAIYSIEISDDTTNTVYNDALDIKQALPISNFNVSNYFPEIGTEINLTNISSDNDVNTWTLDDGTDITTSSELNESVTITTAGAITEKLEISNTITTDTHIETIYGIESPDNAYYKFEVSNTVCRNGETINITPILLYSNPNEHTVDINIYTEDDTLFQTISNVTTTVTTNPLPIDRYTVILTATTGTNVVEYKQIRIITVTPSLQNREDAYEFVLVDTETVYENNGVYTNDITDEDGISPGDTIVVSLPPDYTEEQFFRIRLDNLHGTAEAPIILTIDQPTKLTMNFSSWYGLFIGNCSHIILDGRGYQNIDTGFYITGINDDESVSGVQVGNGSTYIETHNFEFSYTGFAGMVCKTDPVANDPDHWRGNYYMESTTLHNCYFHDTRSEGIYYGYYSMDTKTGKNDNGETVTYRAHEMRDTKVYRNRFIRNGWDAIQLNNATGDTVIHDNYIESFAVYGEADQNTGMSLGLEGKIFNNIINGGSGLGIQCSALGKLDIYNNVISGTPEGSPSLYLLSTILTPEQNVNGTEENDIPITVYNNTLISNGITSTVGAQNVCQYNNFKLINNVYLSTSLFSGQATDTMELWETNSSNNILLVEDDYDLYKIASMTKSDYNIYTDSSLTTGGLLIGDQYDIRGFKNWYSTDKFIGAYAGIIELSDSVLELKSILINGGDSETNDKNVTINITFLGSPLYIMLSEDSEFTDSTWELYSPGDINYKLISSNGDITVYCKIKNDSITSETVSSTITYSERKHILINLNQYDGYVVPELWNDFVSGGIIPIPTGLTLIDLTDQYGDETSLYLEVTKQFDETSSNYTETETYIYDSLVCRINWSSTGDEPSELTLKGCDDTKTYNITLYAVRNYVDKDYILSVNGVEKSYNADTIHTTDEVVTWSNVSPVSGSIIVQAIAGEGPAHIGLLDIWENE